MIETVGRMDILEALLRAPLRITLVRRQAFPARWQVADAVIVTHRFIILEEGEVDYTVEGRRFRVRGGEQIFVPAWCRREWTARSKGVGLLWCEFSSGAGAVPPVLSRRTIGAEREEPRCFERMLGLSGAAESRAGSLLREGELKAALARFWTSATMESEERRAAGAMHPEVTRAMDWLVGNYARADALEEFYRTVMLSPNHFRLLFRKQTGETVQAVLARLRMRRARYLVQETAFPMKRIAAETGFSDPLYFSNQYKRFWGRSASGDRQSGGEA